MLLLVVLLLVVLVRSTYRPARLTAECGGQNIPSVPVHFRRDARWYNLDSPGPHGIPRSWQCRNGGPALRRRCPKLRQYGLASPIPCSPGCPGPILDEPITIWFCRSPWSALPLCQVQAFSRFRLGTHGLDVYGYDVRVSVGVAPLENHAPRYSKNR